MGYLKSMGTVFIYIGAILSFITFLPYLPPDVDFTEYSITPPEETQLNNRLDNAEILFKGELKGPEDFASYNGELYTGLHGGDVVKLVGKHIVPIVKFGRPCDDSLAAEECGRPLGLKFDKNGLLYVADAYYGIFKVDVTSGKYEKIVDITQPIEGKAPKIPNSLDIASNGDIYWTDSSTDFQLHDGVYTFLANPSGRLIRYNAATKKNQVLVKNLGFANGVRLSRDESFVIVAESLTSRITKYTLKGPKAGRAEPFIEGLPGVPDNVQTDSEGNFLVSLAAESSPDHPLIFQSLIPHPNLRKMAARFLFILERPFKLLDEVYPNFYARRIADWLGSFESTMTVGQNRVTVLRIDETGKILEALHAVDGRIYAVSSAYIHKDHLWLGSPFTEFISRVPLKQAFPGSDSHATNHVASKTNMKQESKQVPEPIRTTVPVTSTPPPTTTTPRPTTTTPRPTTTTARPSTTTPTASTTTPRPTTTSPKPSATTPKPTKQTTTPRPTAAPTKPSTTTPKPTTTTPTPTTTTPKPTTTTPRPTTKNIKSDPTIHQPIQVPKQQAAAAEKPVTPEAATTKTDEAMRSTPKPADVRKPTPKSRETTKQTTETKPLKNAEQIPPKVTEPTAKPAGGATPKK